MQRVAIFVALFGVVEILTESKALAGDGAGSRPGLNFIVGGIGTAVGDMRGSGSPRNLAPPPDGVMDRNPADIIRETRRGMTPPDGVMDHSPVGLISGTGSPRSLVPPPDGVMDHGPVGVIQEPILTGVGAGSGQFPKPAAPVDGVTTNNYPQTLVGDAKLANYGKDTATPYRGVSPAPYTDTTGAPTGSGGPVNNSVPYGGDVIQPVTGGGSNGGGSLPYGSNGGSLPYGSGGGNGVQPMASNLNR